MMNNSVGISGCKRSVTSNKPFNDSLASLAVKTVLVAMLSAVTHVSSAFEEFFVPFPEDETLSYLQGISSDALCGAGTDYNNRAGIEPSDDIKTVTDFVVRVGGTIIVIDHFEDDPLTGGVVEGYETVALADIATGVAAPSSVTTRIYGDGDVSNGAAPGVTTDAGDVLVQGQVVVFEESINTATQLNDLEITGRAITGGGTRTQDGVDGGDRIFATETINITRAQWATGSETLFAGAFELFPTVQWGTSFTVPVGENSGSLEFQWTGVTVMAANDNTSVSIDANGDGDFLDPDDVSVILQRGETVGVAGRNNSGGQTTGGLSEGARIFSSDIVQANIISGQECTGYASRWFTLFPDALLGNSYYEPVSTRAANATSIYLYNPSQSTITIEWETTAGMQPSITVLPMSSVSQVIPTGTGARFFTESSATFGALTVIDQAGFDAGTGLATGITNDWGHASTSVRLMGNIVQVGYAEGDDPTSDLATAENGSPVWLTADNIVDPTDTEFQICVDVRGDGGPNTDPNTGISYDYTFTLARLDSARLYDGGRDTPNNVPAHIDDDQSGMLAFVCDGSDAILAAAWGQAPDTASGGAPGVDLGTTVRSVSADVAFIGDTVFEDINNNGVRDPGERGIQGVTVILTPPSGINLGSGPGQSITTITDFNGSYLFTGLTNGDYTIEVIAPSGYAQTFDPDAANGDPLVLDDTSRPTITNANGRLDQDFGYNNNVPVGMIGDFIYTDINGNGIQEAGELGIAGVNVQLCGGDISFTNVAADDFNSFAYNNNAAQWVGNWTELGDDAGGSPTNATAGALGNFDGFRTDINPNGGTALFFRGNGTTGAGPSLTRQFDASGLAELTVTLDMSAFTPGVFEADDQLFVQVSIAGGAFATVGTIDAAALTGAFVPTSFEFDSLGSNNVRIRLQVNGNTINESTPGIEAVFIDDISISTQPCLTQTTDAAGAYLFTGRGEGSYTITVLNPPAGLQNTDDPNGNGDSANQFSLFSSGGNLEQDFGYFTPATVIGHVYIDTNGNGVQEPGEPNIEGLNIEITDANGDLSIVTTDANGDYSASVPPGSTQVNIDTNDPLVIIAGFPNGPFPASFIQTDGVDPSIVTAVAGTTVDAGDDGYFQGNVIGDTVYSEEDGTPGIQGAGDPGIPNTLVTLTPPPTIDLGAGLGVAISQFTDVNGNYSFPGLPDGTYVVTVAQPSGTVQTEDPDGGADSMSSVTIAGGVTNNEQDFGYNNNVPQGFIGDKIYSDLNGNGIQDAGEPGLAGIIVEICGDLDDNNVTANTCRTETTDADGDYLFGDLFLADGTTANAGDTAIPATDGSEVYTITVTNPPAGQTNSQDPDNGLPNFSQLTLSTAGGNLDQDFGYYQPGTVTGHLYIDTNGDGTQQPSEPDLVGVDVVITDSNGDIQIVATDSNGDYSALVPVGDVTTNVDETDPQFPLNHLQTEGTDPTTVTLVAPGGTVDAGIDGYAPAGSIGDLIFFDSSSGGTTGIYDPGVDTGAPNILVTLTPPAGIDVGNGNGVAITTLTDANGNYSFGSLQPGTYSIDVTPPSGVNQTVDPGEPGIQCVTCETTSVVVLAAGETNNLQDFGFQSALPLGQIGDKIFTDANGNGVFDVNESGIAGIRVQLCGDLDNNDGTPATCRIEITDADGDYLFGDGFQGDGVTVDGADTGLPGTNGTEDYTVTVLNPPAGATNTADPDGLTPNVAQLTLPSGISNIDQDFGYVVRSSIAGTVWLDEDLDGILDIEETGITQVQVELVRDGVVIATTVSDANGKYAFPNVIPGNYTVNIVDPSVPAGLQNTAGAKGVDPRPINVPPGTEVNNVDFGYIPNVNTGAIGDRVWFDADQDGIQDPGEAGIEGVTLNLLNAAGATIATTTTNANGDYLFTNVPFGRDYIVSIPTNDPNLVGTTPTVGPQSEGGFVGNPVDLSATSSVITDIDFGFQSPNSNTIIDSFWVDSDRDGIRDIDEQPIANVTVTLYNDANNDGIADDADSDGQPDVVATTTSDANGGVSFTGLADGSYVIAVTDINNQLNNFVGTTGEASVGLSDTVAVAGGATDSQDSFGYNQPGLIAGTVYNDVDNNSDQDAGEAGFSGTTVTLLIDELNNGTYVAVESVLTSPDGSYKFNVNLAGDYRVVVTPPGGTQTEDPDVTVNDQTDITLILGQSSVGNDFGYTNVPGTFTMQGTVFIDPNKNGVEDAGELGIAGVTVDLIDRNDVRGYDVVNGMLDINNDGRITVADDGTVNGIAIIDGMFDIDNNGTINEADSGVVGPFNILEGMVNIAQAGVANQSSTGFEGDPDPNVAIDGNPVGGTPVVSVGPFIHTQGAIGTDYWEVDLGSVSDISQIKIFNRDGNSGRLENVRVLVSDTPFPSDPGDFAGALANADFVYQILGSDLNDPEIALGGIAGRYVRLQKSGTDNVDNFLHFAEIQVTPSLIRASSDAAVASTRTDALGNYTFAGLGNGDYSVAVTDKDVVLAGFDITSGSDVLDRTINNADEFNVDFGYIREEATGSIAGEVFIDENDNGTAQDPEFNLSNVDVHLCRAPLDTGISLPNGVVQFARHAGAYALTTEIESGVLTTSVNETISTFGVLPSDENTDNFGYIYKGFINVTDAGDHFFRTSSDDGSVVFINGVQVVANDGLHGNVSVTSAAVPLTVGFHSIEVRFFERTGGDVFVFDYDTPVSAGFIALPPAVLSSFIVADRCVPGRPSYIASTTSDANGEYIFKNLPPAQYVVDSDEDDIPAGLNKTVDPVTVSLSEGENVTAVDHGYRPAPIGGGNNAGILSGFVWVDVNANGDFDSNEAPISGVTIKVFRRSNGIGSPPVLTTTTRPDGSWIISNIVADLVDDLYVTYQGTDSTVMGVTTNGIDSAAGADLNDVQPTNFPIGDNVYDPVPLLSDDDNNIADLNFGFDPGTTNLGSIRGTIYTDADQNGDLDTGSPSADTKLRNVTVNLLDEAGNVIATTRTNASGQYQFVGLPVGDAVTGVNYRVAITDNINVTRDLNPLETLPALINLRDVAGTSTNPTLGVRSVIEQDAGFISSTTFFSIGNRFFFDANRNGIVDDDESGIEGVTVQCWLDVDQSETPNDPSIASSAVTPEPGIDNLIRTVVTDADGEYVCTSLPAGNYIVVVADANGFDEAADGTLVTGNVGDNFAKNWRYALTLGTTAPNFTADFGVSGNNSLNGFVFVEAEDLVEPDPGATTIGAGDLDGVAGGNLDSTVPGASSADVVATVNVPVDLLIEADDGTFSVIQSTITGADGSYSFDGLPDGRYQVRVRPTGTGIDGYGQTGDPDLALVASDPTDLVCDSATASLCDNTALTPIDLDSASADTNSVTQSGIDFGYQRGFATTPVTMNFFSATRSGGIVSFVWETSNEVGHAGFQVFARINGGWALLNEELLVGNVDVSSEVETKQYTFEAATSAKWFALVDVSNTEEVIARGPFEVGQEYGANLGDKDVFDWSLVEASSLQSLNQIKELVDSKLNQRANEAEEFDPEFDAFLNEVDEQDGE